MTNILKDLAGETFKLIFFEKCVKPVNTFNKTARVKSQCAR